MPKQMNGTCHFPQFVRPRELPTSSLEYISLLMKTAMLELKLDINQPRLHASGIPQNILLVNSIFFGLRKKSASNLPFVGSCAACLQ
jgi:hypothetical protein